MTKLHTLGFPRIGAHRELKFALERYWRAEIDSAALQTEAATRRSENWKQQADAGFDFVTVNDFSLYDQILDHAVMFNLVADRFEQGKANNDLDNYFRQARGRAPSGAPTRALAMTKWFDTNYHYLAPELEADSIDKLALNANKVLSEIEEARQQGYNVKPVLVGPLTLSWLTRGTEAQKLALLEPLAGLYAELLQQLKSAGASWVQIDEPILTLDLPAEWSQAFVDIYNNHFADTSSRPSLLLATYFGVIGNNRDIVTQLPVEGLHLDAVRGGDEYRQLAEVIKTDQVLSLGAIDGRNIWKSDLKALISKIEPLSAQLGDRLWLAPSCSLLHVPVDLSGETNLVHGAENWLAFAVQKLEELRLLQQALSGNVSEDDNKLIVANTQALDERRHSTDVHKEAVKARVASLTASDAKRQSDYAVRAKAQHSRLNLPLWPTTTIGSFPQTPEIRHARAQWRKGSLDDASYKQQMQDEIRHCVEVQEKIGLDMPVHGEAERNDMVEYFGGQLEGYLTTANGWVQSYGSRCVKPPVIYGDIVRPRAMTVEWSTYAQSLTDKPMKGMLTGPVTMLQWAFVRDDQPRATTCRQIALALRDEVCDLEQAGIAAIQIDEPALREGLPLRRGDWDSYLEWACESFRISASGVADDCQIHTHMCYSEFNDIMPAIAALDADVITIETSRNNMVLLDAFKAFDYPNEIGPGVYDIHSPNVPDTESMVALLEKAAERIPADRLWVNPDCGLKTRQWAEVTPALENMVAAAKVLRSRSA